MTTDAESARRAHALLTRAMELSPEERRAFVRSACRADADLGSRVLAMLDAADRSASFLERPALGNLSAFVPQAPDDAAMPDAVGDYLVIGVLGSGGMATVYEAIQETPHRRVALKVMHQSMARTDAYLRFKLEAETLARLSHPGIAQIYEVGAARLGGPTAVPFFAMELVQDAVPITDYARSKDLPLRERIRLFTTVCEAVLHGHQHGVIHRDLKPANILIDAEGRPKIIDFGVARAAQHDGDPITIAAGERQLVGTLNYMSPEQCGMAPDIDTRTDVYSLGVILYQLLFDRLPRRLDDRPLPAALHAVMHEPPERPMNLPAGADRDLEAVVFKAIEQDPDRRYDGVSAFAADLRHWLRHEPTAARAPGLIDQARLFARRNRGPVLAGVAAVASVAVIAAISTVFALRLAAEVDRRRAAEIQTASERDQARWQAYTAQIAGALSAMKTGEFHQMRTRLEEVSYADRGWEWGFLSGLSEQSERHVVAHDAMIMDMAADTRGDRLVTAASDGVIRLWDTHSLRHLAEHRPRDAERRTPDHPRPVAVRFVGGGRFVLAADAAGAVRVLDSSDLSERAVLATLDAPVQSMAELADGRIVVADAAGAASVFDAIRNSSGAGTTPSDPPRATPWPGGQRGGIHGVETAPDGSAIATFNNDGLICVRDPRSLGMIRELVFPGRVDMARFSDDGRVLAAAGAGGRLLIWNTSDGTLLHDIDATGGVNTVRSLAISPDSTRVAVGLIHRGILIFAMESGEPIGELGGHTEAVSALHFVPEDHLISASWDGSLRVWLVSDTTSPSGRSTLKGHTAHVRAVAFSPDGFLVASAARDGFIRLWNPDLAREVGRIAAGSGVNAIDFSPNSATIAAACADGTVRLFNAHTGRAEATLGGHTAWASAVAFDPTGTRVAAGANDGSLRVWDVATHQQTLAVTGHTLRINSVRFSPDGSTIATGSRDRTVRLSDSTTGEPVRVLEGHGLDVFAVLFHPSGDRLYSGSRDQTVRVWNPATGGCDAVLGGHGQYVTSLALNNDATRLAAGSWYGEIVLFDVASDQLIASFRAHDSAIRGVAFSPDGRWLASASYDRTVRLFDSAAREDANSRRASVARSMERSRSLIGAGPVATQADLEQAIAAIAPVDRGPDVEPWLRPILLSHPADPLSHAADPD